MFRALAEGEQRELIKTVAIDWSSLSVRGSCHFCLARWRTGISSIKCVSLCQSRQIQPQRQVSSSADDQIVDACSNPEHFLAHIHNSSCRSEKISTNQQGQVFRGNHAENGSTFLASNKNGSRHSDRRGPVNHRHQICISQLHEFHRSRVSDQGLPANSCNLPTIPSRRRRKDKLCR